MKTKYLLSCSCGRKHPVEATQAGQTLRCTCGEELTVPTMQRLRRLERIDEPDPREVAASAWSLRQKLVLVGAVIAALGLGLSAHVYRGRPQLVEVDQLTLPQSLDVWRAYSHAGEIVLMPGEVEYEILRERNRRWLAVTLGLAGFGAIVMASSLLIASSPRPRR